VAASSRRCRRRCIVAEVLQDHSWIQDITGALTVQVLMQYIEVRQHLQAIQLIPGVADKFIWRWEASSSYSCTRRIEPFSTVRLQCWEHDSSRKPAPQTGGGSLHGCYCFVVAGLMNASTAMTLLGSTIDSCWDRSSALLPINHRLFCRSTVDSITCNREHDRAN
jgi:hypothetical protein